ncbi:MAG: glycosyltransferase family 39 protein, partial [Armatimonadetes bacterium]|nr:glycosyltransferase family 39 protein [Armatimonadota bacterium]
MSRSLGVILGISLLLGLGYAALMPLGAAPDEGAHLQYVRVVAYEARLPQLKLEQRRQSHADPDYESHQAPLYYVLAVPFFRVGEMVAGEAGAGQACRLLSLLFGLVGTALIWRLARDVLPACPEAALAAAALAGFLPMRLYLMASVSNDTLAEAASSLALWCMVRAVQAEWGWKPALRLGISLGVALLAKQNTFLLFPPALVAVYLAARRGSRAAPAAPENGYPLLYFLGTGGITLGTALLLSGWWFFRNHVLYGDPLGLRVFNW